MARIKIDIPNNQLHTCEIPLRINDMNYGGHLGNDRVLTLMHEMRVDFLNKLGYRNELEIEGVGLIVGDVAIQYMQEAFFPCTLHCILSVGDITSKSFELYYTLQQATNGPVIAKGKTGMVCFDYIKRRVTNLPIQLKENLIA